MLTFDGEWFFNPEHVVLIYRDESRMGGRTMLQFMNNGHAMTPKSIEEVCRLLGVTVERLN